MKRIRIGQPTDQFHSYSSPVASQPPGSDPGLQFRSRQATKGPVATSNQKTSQHRLMMLLLMMMMVMAMIMVVMMMIIISMIITMMIMNNDITQQESSSQTNLSTLGKRTLGTFPVSKLHPKRIMAPGRTSTLGMSTAWDFWPQKRYLAQKKTCCVYVKYSSSKLAEKTYPLVNMPKTMENHHLQWIFP